MATAIAQSDNASSNFWLRSRPFDLFFILGIPLVALICGSLMLYDAERFYIIAGLNTLLLATPHVISTFTRIGFDLKSIREFFFLVVPVPLLVIAIVAFMAFSTGSWLISTVYLYWQWWHYTRQSYGISRMYLSQARHNYIPQPLLDNYALYVLPFCGILYRSYQHPDRYLGMDVYTFPVPWMVVLLVGTVAAVLLVLQLIHWTKAYRQGLLPLPYLLYMGSHYVIFITGYLLIDDINFGWLVVNIWHNMQYIAFVWLYNNRRFKSGHDPEHAFLSRISQDNMVWLYFSVCVYWAIVLSGIIKIIGATAYQHEVFPWIMVIYMSINFHHYIADAVVWKRKHRKINASLPATQWAQ